jgi:hypothetical protein
MPLEIGRYIVYDVDSIVYDKFKNEKRSYKFQLKEKIETTFIDNTGQTFYKINRYKKMQDSSGAFIDSIYKIKNVFAASIVNNSLQVVEDNQKYVKLLFPPTLDKTWNGNAFNNLGEQNYFFSKVNENFTLNNQPYSNVSHVVEIQSNPEIKIFKKYYYSTYAKNIGQIEKYVLDIASQNNLNLPIESRIEEGLIYHQKINSYGKE